jgi:predicted transcriptional regulator
MSPLKSDIIRMVEAMPEDCTQDDILYHLRIRRKVEAGLSAIEEGRFVPHEEAKRRLEGWLKAPNPSHLSGLSTRC